jgi:UDP-N-acetylglucosamine:LPS N-acetylglucosamine transferase
VQVLDVLAVTGGVLQAVAERGMLTSLEHPRLRWLFDAEYVAFARFAPTRALGQSLLYRVTGSRVLATVETSAPDIVVSTYPIASEVLGRLRAHGRLNVPVCSVVTDLAGLHYWASPGCDLHLVTHPESIDAVEQIAGAGSARAVQGLASPAFLAPPAQEAARRTLGVPERAEVVAVSGGGWGVGDLAGAIRTLKTIPDVLTLCLCGRNESVYARLQTEFGSDERVRVLPFVDDMATLLTAADALVHSTAGLTVLEAYMVGCRVVSYGFAVGHIRLNDRAFERFGIAEVATTRAELKPAVERALAAPRTPHAAEFARLPAAADLVLGLAAQTRA